jgi:hypothetical protein
MSDLVGWKLVRVSDGAELQSWGGVWGQHPGVPNPLFLPNGDHVHCATHDVQYGDYIIRPWMMDEPPAGPEVAPTESDEVKALKAQLDAQTAQIAAQGQQLAQITGMLGSLAKIASTS